MLEGTDGTDGDERAGLGDLVDRFPQACDASGARPSPVLDGFCAGRPASLRGPWWQVVAGLGRAVASAVAHAHDRGVLHRDIKPPNLIMTPEGGRALLDLGLATVQDAVRATSTVPAGTGAGPWNLVAARRVRARQNSVPVSSPLKRAT